jgi:hypothetical protein
MDPLPQELLTEAAGLFHDVNPALIDAESHREFVITRVLDRGTLKSVRALFRLYGKERILEFMKSGGVHRLARRTVPLWLSFFDIDFASCTPKPSYRPSSSYWKG